jgi:two-component system, NtrC family, sensor histidine kinase HydH
MGGEPDRILEENAPVAITTEELRQLTLSQIVRGLLATRSVLLPFGALAVGVLVALDPSVLKWSLLAFVVLFHLAVSVSDRLRLRRTPSFTQIDLFVIVVLQSGVILLTGGIESPVLIAYVVAGFAAGMALGWSSARIVFAGITLVLWTMSLLGLSGILPRTFPSFLGLEHGFITDVRYVLTKTLAITFATLAAAGLGSRVNSTILKMIGQAIDARQQALETLRDKNRELVHLSSAIAHELKNPLASVQGLVQLLERGGANSEKRFEVLKQEIARMRTTLDAFLNLSRPLGELSIEPVSADSMIEELTALHEGLAVSKSIAIAPSSEQLPRLSCDPRKIKQALTNLLQNAIEATPAGGRVAWIARANGATVSIGVEDSGPGIPPELLSKAADVGVTTKPGGSGIGLAVARSIAEQHGGRLLLENKNDGGLSALLVIPSESRKT